MTSKTLKVDYLARVEGEGAMSIKVSKGKVTDVKLRIFEPPRFFEAFMRGRYFAEAPDITARICGICPIAYQMSAAHAMEEACGVKVTGPLRDLRRLIYCGEWIESHALHIYMLHAPDFLGYNDVLEMAKDHPDAVNKALEIKKIGNDIVTLLGGREIHPINVKVGGFYRVPTKKELLSLRERLLWGRDAAKETIAFAGSLPMPQFEQDYEFVAVSPADEYPFNEGPIKSTRGLSISVSEYEKHFAEEHVAHSNALQSYRRGGGNYFVGPMARYALNSHHLSLESRDAAHAAGLGAVCVNPFQSIVVRSLELMYSFEEALRIVDSYEMPDAPSVRVEPHAGTGYGCTEAPRGTLYHRYTIDNSGAILEAKIVPPTSQNQKTIESDLRRFVGDNLGLPEDQLTWQCEQAIRNYDPCISCATHFLRLNIEE